jgi:hypothetical protein
MKNIVRTIADWGLKKYGNPQSAIRNPQYYYTPFAPSVKEGAALALLHFFAFFFYEKASLRPGSKGVTRKKHRREWQSQGVSRESASR